MDGGLQEARRFNASNSNFAEEESCKDCIKLPETVSDPFHLDVASVQ